MRKKKTAPVRPAGSVDIENVGSPVGTITVELDPRILELFAMGLYRSPTKAVEELTTNSFDAEARRVLVQLPKNTQAPDATIWVADDGDGMDEEGLRHLWMIGRSNKRDRPHSGRQPIGKFGIGKLATFVLGSRLTYVSKSSAGFLAVTMDFERAVGDSKGDATRDPLSLDVRRLTEGQARAALSGISHIGADSAVPLLALFGTAAAPTWTVAAIRGLRPLGMSVTEGRLRWVLSTTLPLGGTFRIWLDGSEVLPHRPNAAPVKTWTIGKEDKVADSLGLSISSSPEGVVIPGIPGVISGSATVYDAPVSKGKSVAVGRSNGFFVRVRGRVVNLEDPLFGLDPLSHTTFAAFRMELHADGLDGLLRSTRESVEERDEVFRFREYLKRKFNEARVFYDEWLSKREYEGLLSTRIDRTPASLSRIPLLDAIRDVIEGGDPLFLTSVPSFPDASDEATFMSSLDIGAADSGLFHTVVLDQVGWDRPIAHYDARERTLHVNSLHPFYTNYAGYFKSLEPFELIAATEVLTEAYMREQGVSPALATETMQRRDRFLRALVLSQQPSVPLVVQMLSEPQIDDELSRLALQSAFSCIGFEVSRLSGRSAPSAIAATLTGGGHHYAVALFCATTDRLAEIQRLGQKDRLSKQLEEYQADYTVLLVPDQPRKTSGSATAAELAEIRASFQQRGVLVLSPADLAKVVIAAATTGIDLGKLEELFRTVRSPGDLDVWIHAVQKASPPRVPIREILDLAWQIQQERRERVQVGMILERSTNPAVRKLSTAAVGELFRSLRRFVGPSITTDGFVVTLEASPESIVTSVVTSLNSLPPGSLSTEPYVIRRKDLPPARVAEDISA